MRLNSPIHPTNELVGFLGSNRKFIRKNNGKLKLKETYNSEDENKNKSK